MLKGAWSSPPRPLRSAMCFAFALPSLAFFILPSHGEFRFSWLGDSPAPSSLTASTSVERQERRRQRPPLRVPEPFRGIIQKEKDCGRNGWLPRPQRAVLFDTLLFHNELDLLEARLHELFEQVDRFFIVELGTTYTNKKKTSNFASCLEESGCAERLEPFLDQVTFIFVQSTPACEHGRTWDCEYSHRDGLTAAFLDSQGSDGDVVMLSDADEFPRASAAWSLAHCQAPEKVHVYPAHFYFSAHCFFPWPCARRSGTRAVSRRVLREMGAQAIRIEKLEEHTWANLTDGSYHFAYLMQPEEMVRKIQSFSHTEFNVYPYNMPAWHLDNARACVFNVAWLHLQGQYIPSDDISYPMVPWFAVANKTAMLRFYEYAREDAMDGAPASNLPGGSGSRHSTPENRTPAAAVTALRIGVCISGQVRNAPHWFEVAPVLRVTSLVDTFAAVPMEDCDTAETALGSQEQGFVRCIPDTPLSAAEEKFIRHGPHIDFNLKDHRRAHVLQYRFIAASMDLLEAHERSRGQRYDFVLRKRADVFLREFPHPALLREQAIYCAYRDKDFNYGGLNDKVLLGRQEEMKHLSSFYSFIIDSASWPSWRWLGAVSTTGGGLGGSIERFSASRLANSTGPAEALLQAFLLARGVAVRALPELRYDKVGRGAESNSREPFINETTGSFNARANPDRFSNVFPRDPYFMVPLINLLLHDSHRSDSKLTVMDVGCGSGYLVEHLLAWDFSIFGLDANSAHLPRIGPYGILADLTVPFDTVPEISASCGMLRHRGPGHLVDGFNLASLQPSIADWVLAIDVGSYIPPEHTSTFFKNIIGYAERGIVLRWGNGPHTVPERFLRHVLEGMGLERMLEAERQFALFSGLVGPVNQNSVLVYVVSGPAWSPEEPTAIVALSVDLSEPNIRAPHCSDGERVWTDGEIELVASYLRLWRSLVRPWEGEAALAPLRLPAVAPAADIAWGAVTWKQMACSSWDFEHILRLLTATAPKLLHGLVDVSSLQRLAKLHRRCTRKPQRAPLLDESSGNWLAVSRSLAETLLGPAASPGRPRGLHRQAWLNRLATRFW